MKVSARAPRALRRSFGLPADKSDHSDHEQKTKD
jgi:hypothetical protein